MKKYRRFNSADYDTWGGAERFNNKALPFIYEADISNNQALLTIIVDKNGIGINISPNDPAEEPITYNKDMVLTSKQAEVELTNLIEYVEKFNTVTELTNELDHPNDEMTTGFIIE